MAPEIDESELSELGTSGPLSETKYTSHQLGLEDTAVPIFKFPTLYDYLKDYISLDDLMKQGLSRLVNTNTSFDSAVLYRPRPDPVSESIEKPEIFLQTRVDQSLVKQREETDDSKPFYTVTIKFTTEIDPNTSKEYVKAVSASRCRCVKA
jgi:hypothetical protein